MDIRGTATASGVYNILAGSVDPELMCRRTSGSGQAPLSSDVLRAYDGYNKDQAEAEPSCLKALLAI